MADITPDDLVKMRNKSERMLNSQGLSTPYTKIQYARMSQAIVNRILDPAVRDNLKQRIENSNADFTPSDAVLNIVFKLALIEAAGQL